MKRESKIAGIVNRLMQGYTDKKIRQELRISKSTYFYWKARIDEEGLTSVMKKQKPGPRPLNEINKNLQEKILSWRDRYGWGPTKIEGHLRVHHNTSISHRQIYYLLQETKKNKPIRFVRRIKGKKRYERAHSMSLLHADWKDVHSNPMLTFMDDHSRFVNASEKFSEATAENSIRLFEFTIRHFGKPNQILTDRGTQFFSVKGGTSSFTQFCNDNGIKHILCSKGSPQANGKLENFHGQYDAEAWRFSTHAKYINYWNYKRPHGGIGFLYPYEVFIRDGPTNSG